MSLSLSRSQFCFPVAQCEFGVTPHWQPAKAAGSGSDPQGAQTLLGLPNGALWIIGQNFESQKLGTLTPYKKIGN